MLSNREKMGSSGGRLTTSFPGKNDKRFICENARPLVFQPFINIPTDAWLTAKAADTIIEHNNAQRDESIKMNKDEMFVEWKFHTDKEFTPK